MQLIEHRTVAWFRRHISVISFVCGFVLDASTFTRIDLLYDNSVFILYLLSAALGILLVHAVETGRWAPRSLRRYRSWLPVLVQFPIGGLLSGSVIFYTKSASMVTSWLFLSILLVLFVGNEILRRRYDRLVFQVGMFYFALLAYAAMLVPVVVGTVGTGVFFTSGILSLFLISLMLQGIMRLFPDVYRHSVKHLALTIGGIFIVWHALYLTNIMPPVPLALKEIGIFHSVVRSKGAYDVTYEPRAWYEVWRQTSEMFHRAPGEAAYCFSAVFAPTRITTDIYHAWLHRNERGVWVRESRIPFTIQGGRDGGYRGYTIMRNLSEGEWRCVVETERGQVLGETRFSVAGVAESVTLTHDTR